MTNATMFSLAANYKIYRSRFNLPALVAYLAAEAAVQGHARPVTSAWCELEARRLWLAKYASRDGGKCEALRVMRDR